MAVLKLKSAEQLAELRRRIDPSQRSATAQALIERLYERGVRSAIVEYDYLDRDFSAEFAAYYATLFHRFERRTQRYHFFLGDVSAALRLEDPAEAAARLSRASDRGRYVGFVVVRPVEDAPIAKAVVDLAAPGSGGEAHLQVRAAYEAHLLGATLRVDALPFTEQDRRMSSCAHAALWVCARHFQARDGSPWLSIPAIAEAAATPMDIVSAQSLPAGAQGLHPDNLTRALKSMGRHPFVFTLSRRGGQKAEWPQGQKPQAILARYLESGIPVILGLAPRAGGDGHTVVACGMPRAPNAPFPVDTEAGQCKPEEEAARRRKDVSCLVSHFLVHDDQRGPALPLPVAASAGDRQGAAGQAPQSVLSLERDVFFMLVPLPEKVYVPAESAELKAWNNLDAYAEAWNRVRAQLGGEFDPEAVAAGDALAKARRDGTLVARTYLILGWKYKRWLLTATSSKTLRSRVMLRSLPKLLWVTEFGLFHDLQRPVPSDRRILSHCVVDATTAGSRHPPLLFHGPGLLTVWEQGHEPATALRRSMFPIPDDRPYVPRCRIDRGVASPP